jgi:hypothetical protein
MLHVQSLAELALARTGLLRGAANVHAEAIAAHESKLQAEVAAVRKIQGIKEAMACQARKDADNLKQKLEDAERKAKDAASDLLAVVEGTLSSLLWADSVVFVSSLSQLFDLEPLQGLARPRRPSGKSWRHSRASSRPSRRIPQRPGKVSALLVVCE